MCSTRVQGRGYPQFVMNNYWPVRAASCRKVNGNTIYLRDIADWRKKLNRQYDRINQQRFITVTANIHKRDLGGAIHDVNKAIAQLGELPTG